jgi:hypothetical protein
MHNHIIFKIKMKFADLIDNSIECIKSFNPIIKTIDSHADDFLKDVSVVV